MLLNEKKVIEYLKKNIGGNATTRSLAIESGATEGMSEDELNRNMAEIDRMIWDIAEGNGFRLNNDHCKDELRGMPWVFDFFIELREDKDVPRILSKPSPAERMRMIEDEYGLYDMNDVLAGFRLGIPASIKQIYDDSRRETEEYQEG